MTKQTLINTADAPFTKWEKLYFAGFAAILLLNVYIWFGLAPFVVVGVIALAAAAVFGLAILNEKSGGLIGVFFSILAFLG